MKRKNNMAETPSVESSGDKIVTAPEALVESNIAKEISPVSSSDLHLADIMGAGEQEYPGTPEAHKQAINKILLDLAPIVARLNTEVFEKDSEEFRNLAKDAEVYFLQASLILDSYKGAVDLHYPQLRGLQLAVTRAAQTLSMITRSGRVYFKDNNAIRQAHISEIESYTARIGGWQTAIKRGKKEILNVQQNELPQELRLIYVDMLDKSQNYQSILERKRKLLNIKNKRIPFWKSKLDPRDFFESGYSGLYEETQNIFNELVGLERPSSSRIVIQEIERVLPDRLVTVRIEQLEKEDELFEKAQEEFAKQS